MSVLDFANEYLFTPLNIEKRTNANCFNAKDQLEYAMSKKNHGKVWFLDPTNMPTAGWGLSLSAYEMAQIGLMVLNKGIYNNKRAQAHQQEESMYTVIVADDEEEISVEMPRE